MNRERREPPLIQRFLDSSGRLLHQKSKKGAPRKQPRSASEVPRSERRVTVTCGRGHFLAVVRHDGLLFVEGVEWPGFVLLEDGWAPLVTVGTEPTRAGPVLGEPVRMVCVTCNFLVYELAAEDVPPRGGVEARLVDRSG